MSLIYRSAGHSTENMDYIMSMATFPGHLNTWFPSGSLANMTKRLSVKKSGPSKTRSFSTSSRAGKPSVQLSEVIHEFIIRKNPSTFQLRVGRTWKLPILRGATWLALDYDGVQSVDERAIRSRLGLCGVQVLRTIKRRSPGNHGIHVGIQVQGIFSRWQITALQAICQSDLTRESFNFRRALAAGSDAEWKKFNVLFTESKRRR